MPNCGRTALFRAALSLPDPAQRQRQVRDAALIGIMASRGPRLRAEGGMRLRHLRRVGEHWHLDFDAGLMKGGRSSLELRLSARVAAIVERYLAVERQELLRGATHDFVWVARHGGPLSEKGIDFMIRSRTKVQYGVAFGSAPLPGRPHHHPGAGRRQRTCSARRASWPTRRRSH